MIFSSFNIDFFEFNDLKLVLNYNFDKEIFFKETIDFNIWKQFINYDKDILDYLFYNILISSWISYYKLYPFANIKLPINFSDKRINFWKKFYIHWLWEFLYKNKLNPNIIKIINWTKKIKLDNFKHNNFINKSLLLWWGWKDSIVSSQIIKSDYDLLVVWKLDLIKLETAKVLWKTPILIKRQLDEKLFELNNNKNFYNWHVPITWIISFISFATAYLYWYNAVYTSNEKSAYEENIIWKWHKINHQYSKSIQFEKDFLDYNNSLNIDYKSLLSDLYEIEIAQKFSNFKEFFPYFSSCNRNFTINKKSNTNKRWCCNCEKCAFVRLILSPFIEIDELEKIFWENLFEKKELYEIYLWLIWAKQKPFECVWTYNESKKAFKLVLKKYSNWKLPIILKKIKKHID